VERFKEVYAEIYQKHRRMIDVYRMARIPLPEEYQFVVEHKLSDDFNALINEEILNNAGVFERAHAIRILAKESGLKLNRASSERFFSKRLNENMINLHAKWDDAIAKDCCDVVRVAGRLGVNIDLRTAQEYYMVILSKLESDKSYLSSASAQSLLDFMDLGSQLAINVEKFKINLQKLMASSAVLSGRPTKISRITL
jgi:hypothetical protein